MPQFARALKPPARNGAQTISSMFGSSRPGARPRHRLIRHPSPGLGVSIRSNLPVLIISADCEEKSKITGLGLGADGYITKPFSLKELEAYTRAILRRSTVSALACDSPDPTEPHTRLRCHGVEMLLDRVEAYVDGQPIELSRTEFDLLRYFMEHAGVAVTAEQLVAAVWGYSGYDRHIVETNVYRLRRKIEHDANDSRRLVTVRGFGYKFTAGADGQGLHTGNGG